MLDSATAGMVSPVFAGREAEFTMLATAFEYSDAACVTVLVGGEAGSGKSRLIREFAAKARRSAGPDGVLILCGGCPETSGGGLPYAPFTAVVRQLADELSPAQMADLLGGYGTAPDNANLADLLGRSGASPGDADLAGLFGRLATLLNRLARVAPLILIVEDAHRADRSTRDLLRFLVRNGRLARVLIVVTYSSDEVHRTHPFRPVLADLSRAPNVSMLELPRLQRADVAAQLAGILGRPPAPAVVDAAYARTGGIPMFVEAIVNGDGTVRCCRPDSPSDLLLEGVRRLPEDTQQVLRIASASGGRTGHALLAAVTGLSEHALCAALQPAAAANVLVSRDGGYEFAHSLTREAVHDVLSGPEHVHVHARFARALESDPSLAVPGRPAVQLTLHWRSAHEYDRAMLAAWRAAADAEIACAYAEQLEMLEQMLELWEQAPSAPAQIGADHTGILERAARAAQRAGNPGRCARLAQAALGESAGPRAARSTALLRLLAEANQVRRTIDPSHHGTWPGC